MRYLRFAITLITVVASTWLWFLLPELQDILLSLVIVGTATALVVVLAFHFPLVRGMVVTTVLVVGLVQAHAWRWAMLVVVLWAIGLCFHIWAPRKEEVR